MNKITVEQSNNSQTLRLRVKSKTELTQNAQSRSSVLCCKSKHPPAHIRLNHDHNDSVYSLYVSATASHKHTLVSVLSSITHQVIIRLYRHTLFSRIESLQVPQYNHITNQQVFQVKTQVTLELKFLQ